MQNAVIKFTLPAVLAMFCPLRADASNFTVDLPVDGGVVNTFDGIQGGIVIGGDDGGAVVGDTFTNTISFEANGVTFDVTLNVTGSDDLSQLTSGLGVDSDAAANLEDFLNFGEHLFFAEVVITNVTGGTVAFDGFTQIDFNNLQAPNESAVVSDDASIDALDIAVPGDTNLFDLSATSPDAFYVIPKTPISGDNGFRVDDVTASFTVVPEPASLALLGLGILMLQRRRLL